MRAIWLLLVLAGAAPAGDEIFVNPRPFGPDQIAFPGNCQFSPDGKWVAFMDGSRAYLAIWDLAQNKQVWTQKLTCGSHRFMFARKGKHVASIIEKGLLVVALTEDTWDVESTTSIGFKPAITKGLAPALISPNYDASAVFFVDHGKNYSAKKGKAPPKPLDEKKGETSYATLDLDRTGTAFSMSKPLKTKILSGRGQENIKGIVVAGSADRAFLLVAMNAKFDSGKANMLIFDRAARKKASKFQLSKGARRPLLHAFFSPDSKLLVTVEGRGHISLRDPRSGKVKQKLTAPKGGYFVDAAFSPDGKHLLTAGMRTGEPGVLLWDRK